MVSLSNHAVSAGSELIVVVGDATAGDATVFDDGKGTLTVSVRPIPKFSLIETITASIRDVSGVADVRLRRVQRSGQSFRLQGG